MTAQWELCSSIYPLVSKVKFWSHSTKKLDEEIPEPSFLADPSHRVKVFAKHIFSIVNKSRSQRCWCTKADALQIKKYWGYMIKIIGKKQLNSWVRQVGSPSSTHLTVMTIVIHSGTSRQEHQKKEINTTTKTMNPAVKKRQSAVQSPENDYFTVSNIQSSKRVTEYVWHTKKRIN